MLRITWYLYETDNSKPLTFDSEKAAKDWWKSSRLSPFPTEKLIKVETNVMALEKAVEESRKRQAD